jgi:hypothetical protein
MTNSDDNDNYNFIDFPSSLHDEIVKDLLNEARNKFGDALSEEEFMEVLNEYYSNNPTDAKLELATDKAFYLADTCEKMIRFHIKDFSNKISKMTDSEKEEHEELRVTHMGNQTLFLAEIMSIVKALRTDDLQLIDQIINKLYTLMKNIGEYNRQENRILKTIQSEVK